MMSAQQQVMPGFEPEGPNSDSTRKSGEKVWYYVRDAKNRRMVCFCADGVPYGWRPLDLHDPHIAVFSSRRVALDASRQVKGYVERYPYSIQWLRTRPR